MIIRVFDDNRADICDELLTKLIQDERKYDDSININFKVKDYFRNVIKNKNNILLCYEDNNIVVGYIFLKIINNNEKKGYLIDGLYVEEEYRGRGIATKLIDYAINIVKDTEVAFIDINVLANNEIAFKLYKSLGFNEFKINMRKEI